MPEARDDWNGLDELMRAEQHPKAHELFSPGALRNQCDAFIDDDSSVLEDFEMLEEYLAPLQLAQIAERIMEAAHRELNVEASRVGPVLLSLSLRVPEETRKLQLQPESFEDLTMAYAQVRKVRDFAKDFRWTRLAPGLAELASLRSIFDVACCCDWHRL